MAGMSFDLARPERPVKKTLATQEELNKENWGQKRFAC
jgi:hypothetical protein